MLSIGGIPIEAPLALGPMAGVTDMAFRTICREQGAALTCTEMVSTTGCGDSFMAALTWAYLQGSDLERSARAGLAASSLTMESAETIHPSMSEAELLRRMAL